MMYLYAVTNRIRIVTAALLDVRRDGDLHVPSLIQDQGAGNRGRDPVENHHEERSTKRSIVTVLTMKSKWSV